MMCSKKLLSTFLYIFFAVFGSMCPHIMAPKPGELDASTRRSPAAKALSSLRRSIENEKPKAFSISSTESAPLRPVISHAETTDDIDTLCRAIVKLFSKHLHLPDRAAINRAILRTRRCDHYTVEVIDTAISMAMAHLHEPCV